jgi:hypothetical protein
MALHIVPEEDWCDKGLCFPTCGYMTDLNTYQEIANPIIVAS